MNLLGFLLLMTPIFSIMAYNYGKHEPGKHEPGKHEPGKHEPGKLMYTHKNGTIEYIDLFKPQDFHDMDVYKFLIALSIANMLVILFISRLLYKEVQDNSHSSASTSSSSTSSSNDDYTSEDEIVYESQYFDKLEEIPDKVLSTEELDIIGSHHLIEETPKGLVVISYNVDTETFEYYTDKLSDISYEILDTVARLFTITFDCKQICVNYRKEIQEGENRMLSDIEYDNMMKERDADTNPGKDKERSVFAKFKSYNNKNGNNVVKKYYIIPEKANKFKYKGKLLDYEKLIKKPTEDESKKNIKQVSYSDFKQLQEANSNLEKEYIHVEDVTKLKDD
jgi:hypothetical protein